MMIPLIPLLHVVLYFLKWKFLSIWEPLGVDVSERRKFLGIEGKMSRWDYYDLHFWRRVKPIMDPNA